METQNLRLDPVSLSTCCDRFVRRAHLLLFSLACLTMLPPGLSAASSIQLHSDPRELQVLYQNRTVLAYAFGTNQFKPYVRSLFTLDGIDLLRDAPADHLHHHGLMYAIKVNEINFWEEAPNAGHQVPRTDLVRDFKKNVDGQPVSQFSQVLHWVTATNATLPDTTPAALLIEKRTIALTVLPQSEQLLLEWISEFGLGPETPQVTLTGANYHGLGMRFRAEFDGVAARRNSEAQAYPEDGAQGVLPARWMAVSHVVAGRPYTLTLFQHPANPGTPRFFSMQKPFAYLSATQGLDEAPITYRAGDHWTLRYLLIASPGRPTNEQLDRHYHAFTRP